MEDSIKFSVSVIVKEEYSYDQYHWCPVALIETRGFFVSSIMYKVFSEGMAIKINMIDGRMVQMVSISCPSVTYLLKILLFIIEMSKYKVKIVIRVKIIIAWS